MPCAGSGKQQRTGVIKLEAALSVYINYCTLRFLRVDGVGRLTKKVENVISECNRHE